MMAKKPNRIISLLPSTTEIVSALGLEPKLVGRSHECDYPEGITALPACTEPKFNPDGTSYELDQRVKALLQEGLSVYRVDAEKLAALQPDVIITQDHCEVCAASFSEVKQAVHQCLSPDVQVISVSPTDLSGVLNSIRSIAQALKTESKGEKLINRLNDRLHTLQKETTSLPSKSIVCIEWLDPLMTAGNWVPELVELAGGRPLGAEPGAHSPWMKWETVRELDPDILAIIPCGYSIQQTLKEIGSLTDRQGWQSMQAVQNKKVFILDGNQYFNRPGPRLTDSAAILAEILHPDLFPPSYKNRGWINLYEQPKTSGNAE